jgi:hypothetical protein
MRLLIWHVDRFASTPGQRGRSPVTDPLPWPVEVPNALLVFAAAEPPDELEPAKAGARAAGVIADAAARVKAHMVVLHSFSHLFGELASPAGAQAVLHATQVALQARGLACLQTPFGWFNSLDIQAKGHPLSRMARIV